MFNEGQAVRNRNDPSQVGVVTGETRDTPGVGRWLERDLKTDQERLLLAWGLAQDPGTDAIPQIRPPSQVIPILQRVRDWQGDYVGPEAC